MAVGAFEPQFYAQVLERLGIADVRAHMQSRSAARDVARERGRARRQ